MVKFNMLKKNRWKILSGWLAFELIGAAIAMPAMANLTDRVQLEVPQIVVVKTLSSQPGETVFQVASNAPFALLSSGQLGEFGIEVTPKGANSQRVGQASNCAVTLSAMPTRIFTAQRKTASKRGDTDSQSIVITVTYDPSLNPQLSIAAMDKAPAMLALPCRVGEM